MEAKSDVEEIQEIEYVFRKDGSSTGKLFKRFPPTYNLAPVGVSPVGKWCFSKRIDRHAGLTSADESRWEFICLLSEKHDQSGAVRSSSVHDKDFTSGAPVYSIGAGMTILRRGENCQLSMWVGGSEIK